MDAANQDGTDKPPMPTTTPPDLSVRGLGFDDPTFAEEVAPQLSEVFVGFGRSFDLSRLDGVTIALDYRKALLDLDRGYETDFKLKPTESFGRGVAMTPSVLRDGTLKSHMLFDANELFSMFRDKQGPEASIWWRTSARMSRSTPSSTRRSPKRC